MTTKKKTDPWLDGFADGVQRLIGCIAGKTDVRYLQGLLTAIQKSESRVIAKIAKVRKNA